MTIEQLFNQRVAVLATMHHKEKVIAPILQKELGIKVIIPENFNTDTFGTFTRDIKRVSTQIATARIKAEKAIEITEETIGIASEGSFAPHPSFPYIYANREIVIFIDKVNNLEIIGEEFSTETNFSHQVITTFSEAEEFAQKVGFPGHGLVIWFEGKSKDSPQMIKGIDSEQKLLEAVSFGFHNSPDGQINIETDMRALYNPTRMQNIAKATENLLKKINTCCPKCSTPGFSLTERIQGLPCEMCHQPTSLTLAAVYECRKCGFTQEKMFPDGREIADPAYCFYCNP